MTRPTARQRILAYLRLHKGASAEEISQALGVSAANIRRHLSILASDGRVQLLGPRLGAHAGRPVQVYALSQAALGENLAGLLDVFLSQQLDALSASDRELVLQALAARLMPAPAGAVDTHITRRLAALIAQLDRLGYAARWEAHASAPRIIFEHCPYAAIVAKHPELCQMDVYLLGQQLGAEVQQTAWQEKSARGTQFCQFALWHIL